MQRVWHMRQWSKQDAALPGPEMGDRTLPGARMVAELFPDVPRAEMERGATLSPNGRYRYDLTRRWELGPTVCWVMLNPSTADATLDDPTIRRVVGFSRAAGYGRAVVVNAFALRATQPRELFKAPDPIGPDNDAIIRFWATNATEVVAAWGAFTLHKWQFKDRPKRVLAALVALRHVRCLGKTAGGHPRHPLYVPAAATFRPYP